MVSVVGGDFLPRKRKEDRLSGGDEGDYVSDKIQALSMRARGRWQNDRRGETPAVAVRTKVEWGRTW